MPLRNHKKCLGDIFCAKQRPEFEPDEVGAEAAKLETFSTGSLKTHRLWGGVQAGLKFSGCPTPADSLFLTVSSITTLSLYYYPFQRIPFSSIMGA